MKRSQAPASLPKTAPDQRFSRATSRITSGKRWLSLAYLGYTLTGLWAGVGAIATASNLGMVELMERQAQTLFFELRGPVSPPDNVIILAIDETSLAQQEFYRSDPKTYGYLEPIQTWPWQRSAYAIAIQKLMDAGAEAIALDVVLSTSSSYGEDDDLRLEQTLQAYPDKVVLAAQYADVETAQGTMTQLVQPLPRFRDHAAIGFINFYLEPDGKIHRLGDRFLTELIQNAPPYQAQAYEFLTQGTPDFAAATVQIAEPDSPSPTGDTLFFYGGRQTFEQIPFWYVLDEKTWSTTLQSGDYFKDKIVLIGSTAAMHQDFHAAPFSETWSHPQPMAGVEIHANAIAALLQNKVIADAVPQAPLRAVIVLLVGVAAGGLMSLPKQPLMRWLLAMGIALAWGGMGYLAFVYGQQILPTAVPVTAIALSGFSQLLTGTAREQRSKHQLREALKQYVTSPVVQEIISQQDDLQDLLQERERVLAGQLLSGRYRIVHVLGTGGFSETYTAEDLLRPGHPLCVVKQLRVLSNQPKTIQLARRLFVTEAETLERLGQHDRIPQLLASFEEAQEFYLIQQFVPGHPLSHELRPSRIFSESEVILMLHELVQILEFVHDQGVIHRDLKPSNILRRKGDNRLVLIDFGVAKKITTQIAESDLDAKYTIAVGTPGYMGNEQLAGKPRFNSDLYALGMVGIEALTGRAPHLLNSDPSTGEVRWSHEARHVSPGLKTILDRLVHPDCNYRYQSAQEVREILENLPNFDAAIAAWIDPPARLHSASYEETQPLESADTDTAALPDNWHEKWDDSTIEHID